MVCVRKKLYVYIRYSTISYTKYYIFRIQYVVYNKELQYSLLPPFLNQTRDQSLARDPIGKNTGQLATYPAAVDFEMTGGGDDDVCV